MADEEIDLCPVTANGRAFPVTFELLGDVATFVTQVGTTRIREYTWRALVDKVKIAERKTRVKVAVEFVDPETGERGTATGLHATTGRPIIRWADWRTAQNSGVSNPLRPDTDVAELKRLHAAYRAAGRELREFQNANRIEGAYSVGDAVSKAMDAAQVELARVESAADVPDDAPDLDAVAR